MRFGKYVDVTLYKAITVLVMLFKKIMATQLNVYFQAVGSSLEVAGYLMYLFYYNLGISLFLPSCGRRGYYASVFPTACASVKLTCPSFLAVCLQQQGENIVSSSL